MQAAAEVVYVPGLQGAESATLMGAVGVRLRAALRSPSAPLICSAARTAGLSCSKLHCGLNSCAVCQFALSARAAVLGVCLGAMLSCMSVTPSMCLCVCVCVLCICLCKALHAAVPPSREGFLFLQQLSLPPFASGFQKISALQLHISNLHAQ